MKAVLNGTKLVIFNLKSTTSYFRSWGIRKHQWIYDYFALFQESRGERSTGGQERIACSQRSQQLSGALFA